jgi:crossover junction endodeoxyribonuclease RusA
MIALTLPFPPSTNTYIRHSNGMHFPTAKAKAFRKEVWAIVKAANVTTMRERLHVTMTLHAPTRARRDVDNYAKSALDSLQLAGCFADDEQIDSLVIHRGPLIKGGALRVEIKAHVVQRPQQVALPMLTAKQVRDAEIDARIPL